MVGVAKALASFYYPACLLMEYFYSTSILEPLEIELGWLHTTLAILR